VNLKPWPKGVSGNLAGRPKGLAALARRAREVTGNGEKLVEFFLDRLEHGNRREQMEAALWFSDRGWGRPGQIIEEPAEGDDSSGSESEKKPVVVHVSWGKRGAAE
jgi:hypothetical protein